MFVLAILLLLAALALVAWVFYGLNGQPSNSVHFDSIGINTDISPIVLFGLGALTLLLVWAASRLFAAATRRKYRDHKERRASQKEVKALKEERSQLAHDRDAAEAERQRLAFERDAHGAHEVDPHNAQTQVIDTDAPRGRHLR